MRAMMAMSVLVGGVLCVAQGQAQGQAQTQTQTLGQAQMGSGGRSAVPSEHAGNILDGSPELANSLPAPDATADTIGALLNSASGAVQARHYGAAQEALEQAESRALDRSVVAVDAGKPIADPLVAHIYQARQALGAKDYEAAQKAIDAARATTPSL